MILRNLLRRRTRSLLTVVGIAIGVAAVVAFTGMAEAYAEQFTSMLRRSGADLTVMQAKASDISFSTVDERVGREIAGLSGVRAVSGLTFGIVSVKGLPYFIVFGLDPRELAIRHFIASRGERIADDRQIMLGKTAAQTLKLGVGDTIRLFNQPYRVSGIYETGIGFEDAGAVISLRSAQALFKKPRQVAMYQIKLKNLDDAEAVQRTVEKRFPDVSVAKSSEFTETRQDFQIARGFAWGISSIAVLVGGVGMLNTMSMSVFERTREIGVLRAVGWRRRRVLLMVFKESLALSAIGGVVGVVLGLLLLWGLSSLPVMAGFFAVTFNPGIILQALTVALVLGALGGLYPAYRASRLSPVEALRYE